MPKPAILWEYIEFPWRLRDRFYLSKTIGGGQYEALWNNTYFLLNETWMYSIYRESLFDVNPPFHPASQSP